MIFKLNLNYKLRDFFDYIFRYSPLEICLESIFYSIEKRINNIISKMVKREISFSYC